MKYFLLPLSLCFISFCSSKAQPLNRLQDSKNFYDIKAYYESLFKNFEGKQESFTNRKGRDEESEQDNEWLIYQRWKNFYEPRVYPTGMMDYEQRMFSIYQEEKNKNSSLRDFGSDEHWSIVGPSVVPNYGGIGRVNSMAFNPNDSDIIWIGTPSGGLWKSTDGGMSWTTNTDLFPVLGISDIAINPENPLTMYIGTGDRDAGDTRSIGILKSTDGGVTWDSTGLIYSTYDFQSVYRILLYPEQTNTLLACTNTGIFKTTDGGVTWTQKFSSFIRDLEFKPGHDSTVYASSGNRFYISHDMGENWTESSSGLPISNSGRLKIAVTAAAPDYVYVLSTDNSTWGYNGVYRSTNGGSSWSEMSSTPNLMGWDVNGGDTGGQGWYTLSIAADPDDANTIYVGGVDIWKSTDGGANWTCVAHWYGANGVPYVHADIHYLHTDHNGVVYSLCDGGIFKTTDAASSWNDLSANLAITQYYRFGNSATDSAEVIGGAQDNGTSLFRDSSWAEVYGGDGMESLIDFTDADVMYAEVYFGYMGRSFDGGNYFTDITPGGGQGAWVTPYIIDPNNHKHLIEGDKEIHQTDNYGDSWTQSTNGQTNGNQFQSIAIAPSNSNVIYAATYYQLLKTTDGGTTWTDITGNLPAGLPAITYIAVKDSNENTLWITCSGFSAGNKVFRSDDGGTTWQNISAGIPNISVNCIVYKNGDDDELYAGTELGVYYKEKYLSNWIHIDNGLPNVIVNELEIQYASGKLRAATYGRGIWETPLVDPIIFDVDATVAAISAPQGLVCSSQIDPVVTIKNYGLDTLYTVDINYSIDNGTVSIYNFSGAIPSLGSVDIALPSQSVAAGNHLFKAYTSNPNNSTDDFPLNDLDSSLYNFVAEGTVPLTEGFEEPGIPQDWQIQNSDNSYTWRKVTPGAWGQSDSSLFIELYYYGSIGQLDNFVSPSLDLTSFSNYAKLSFDVADCRYSADYSDSLFVLVSPDCGQEWTRYYSKGGESLATAPDNTGWFYPAADQWRHEVIDLSNFLGQKILINFQCRNGYGNNLYIDNINLSDEPLISDNLNSETIFTCSPNPASSFVNVEMKSSSQIVSLQLLNSLGEIVYENKLSGNQSHFTIDISKFPEGIYYATMKTENEMSTRKIAIQR